MDHGGWSQFKYPDRYQLTGYQLTLLYTRLIAVWRRRKRKNNVFTQHYLAIVRQYLKHTSCYIHLCPMMNIAVEYRLK